MPGARESGDLHVIHEFSEGLLIGAMDGLGHGTEAAVASRLCAPLLTEYSGEPLDKIVAKCHVGLRGTAGVALSVCTLNQKAMAWSWIGVGDVSAVLLREGLSLLDQISEQIRRLSHELKPTILDDLGLLPALMFLAEGVSSRSKIPVTVKGKLEARLAPAVETAIYRAVQEALNNLKKHARATEAVVHVRTDYGRIVCSVRDDGAGFDEAAVFRGNGTFGIGMIGTRERLHALRGTLQITSAQGRGTDLIITVPTEG